MAKAMKKAAVAVPKAMKKKKAKAMKVKPGVAVKFFGGKGEKDKMEIVWKNHLHNAIMVASGGKVVTKPTYTCAAGKGSAPGAELFKCTLQYSGKSYASPEAQPSKQAAEHAAAKVCMEAMYPEPYKFVTKGREIGGAKKKLAEEEKPEIGPKGKFCAGVQLMVLKTLKRGLQPGDITWETEEKDGKYKCKVTLAKTIGGKSFVGGSCDSKKAGEDLAASTAYTQMKSTFAPLETAALAAKKAKNKAKVELLKKKQAAKKAAAK
jgi:hypothetical protein